MGIRKVQSERYIKLGKSYAWTKFQCSFKFIQKLYVEAAVSKQNNKHFKLSRKNKSNSLGCRAVDMVANFTIWYTALL
jgi:hypothetical protein